MECESEFSYHKPFVKLLLKVSTILYDPVRHVICKTSHLFIYLFLAINNFHTTVLLNA